MAHRVYFPYFDVKVNSMIYTRQRFIQVQATVKRNTLRNIQCIDFALDYCYKGVLLSLFVQFRGQVNDSSTSRLTQKISNSIIEQSFTPFHPTQSVYLFYQMAGTYWSTFSWQKTVSYDTCPFYRLLRLWCRTKPQQQCRSTRSYLQVR